MANIGSPPTLSEELDEAMMALTAFDAEHLEAIEHRIRTMAAERLADTRQLLPEIVEKHALLGQLIETTQANLKVLVSVMNLESRMELR